MSEVDQKRGNCTARSVRSSPSSVYGLQRMPVTLYVEQWQRLLDYADDIRQFLKDNDASFKRKEKPQ